MPLVILFCIVAQGFINFSMVSYFVRIGMSSAKRSTFLNNMVSGIKSVKFNAWENFMFQKLKKIRLNEKSMFISVQVIKTMGDVVIRVVPALNGIVCFTIYQSAVGDLTLSKAYSVLIMLNLLVQPLAILQITIISLNTGKAAIFRMLPLIKVPAEEEEIDNFQVPKGQVEIKNGDFTWENNEYQKLFSVTDAGSFARQKANNESQKVRKNEVYLKNVNLKITPGQFVSIIGRVGSGKSALVLSMMKELGLEAGSVDKNGSIGYISQEAFLLNATLRDNVTFGKPFDKAKYEHVLDICQMLPDIKMLPGGDLTEIGERGINLSGGQKARVSIARAVYADCDIYLIDDCLSALDAYVGKAIMDKVFCGYLKDRTRIMTTHHIHVLEEMDQVILMESGKIAAQGKYHDIRNLKAFQDYAVGQEEKDKKNFTGGRDKPAGRSDGFKSIKDDSDTGSGGTGEANNQNQDPANNPLDSARTPLVSNRNGGNRRGREDQIALGEGNAAKGKLSRTEVRYTGLVGLESYKFMIRKGGKGLFGVTVLFLILSTAFQQLSSWWVGQWAFDTYGYSLWSYVAIYALLIFLYLFTYFFSAIFLAFFMINAAMNIFSSVIWNILRRPMRFFDTTPIGILMNICTTDMGVIDLILPIFIGMLLQNIFMILGNFAVALITTPLVIPVFLITFFFFTIILGQFTRASTEIRRLKQLATSPYTSKMVELLNGQIEFRVYEFTEKALGKIIEKHNIIQTAYLHEEYSKVWLSVKMSILVILNIIVCGVLVVLGKEMG